MKLPFLARLFGGQQSGGKQLSAREKVGFLVPVAAAAAGML